MTASRSHMNSTGIFALCAFSVLFVGSGCVTSSLHEFDRLPEIEKTDIPRELDKASIPTYRVEPPDVLLIEAVSNIRPSDDPLRPGETLFIRAANTLPLDPMADPVENEFRLINGPYQIQPDGRIDLGPVYGQVELAGLSFAEAEAAVIRHLKEEVGLGDPQVAVSFSDVAGKQVITGEHLVRPDGTVSLGIYGSLYVNGMTLDEVKHAVEEYLADKIESPEISVDVLGYNSKVYYIITDGAGYGETVVRLPYTGNETVLDAMSQVNGISEVSSSRMWVARPAPSGTQVAQTMLIDWRAIVQDGVTTTNYQLFPGDRIYIKADDWVKTDNVIAKVTSPFERIFGFILLGHGLQRTLQFGHINNNGGGNNNNGGNVGFFP